MQLLADKGIEFGEHQGLGWIGGTVHAIEAPSADDQNSAYGLERCDAQRRAMNCWKQERPIISMAIISMPRTNAEIFATTYHGMKLVSAVGRDNIVGVQFHPEKSQAYGLAFLKRFLEWKP